MKDLEKSPKFWNKPQSLDAWHFIFLRSTPFSLNELLIFYLESNQIHQPLYNIVRG